MWESVNNPSCDICHRKKKHRRNSSQDHPYLDKENHFRFSPMKTEDISLYENSSPLPTSCSDSSPRCPQNRRALVEHDSNSQDSGYGASYHGEKFLSYASPTRGSSLSFGSGSICSMEDDFLEDFSDIEPLDKHSNLPEDFSKLINDPLIHRTKSQEKKTSPRDTIIRPLLRRALSLQNGVTPNSSRVRTSLFKTAENEIRSFKRPEPPSDADNTLIKRSRLFDSHNAVPVARPILQRAFSATEESIMCAVQRSSTEPDLIGDFTKNVCLPLTRSKHPDLKAITSDTLARLMRGEFNDKVASFKVIDCRYPYEFEGGHIHGALNVYTKDQCLELLHETHLPVNDSQRRHILVFHCEFSSERGPNLYRYLRKEDRQQNENDYPSLHYPEIYLLEGGYKSFFQSYSKMCDPIAYKEMLHPDHEEDLRHFRQKSKTWNSDSRPRPQYSKSLKRL